MCGIGVARLWRGKFVSFSQGSFASQVLDAKMAHERYATYMTTPPAYYIRSKFLDESNHSYFVLVKTKKPAGGLLRKFIKEANE